MMKKNILIKNGVVVDPIFKTQEQRDVYIQSGRIASAKNFTGADIVIDASGNLVVPGLIDFHSHVFADGTEIGIEPDLSFIPQLLLMQVVPVLQILNALKKMLSNALKCVSKLL